MKLIMGLGNLGDEYAKNRHNLGFLVIDELAGRHGATLGKSNHLALSAQIDVDGQKVMLAKPSTMMNLSGQAAAKLVRFFKLEPTDAWVVHDELDLDFGTLRIREGSGSGGHNGVASVIEAIGPHCIRWRIGIGRPSGKLAAADFVLKDFTKAEQSKINEIVSNTADAIEDALEHGHEATTKNLLK